MYELIIVKTSAKNILWLQINFVWVFLKFKMRNSKIQNMINEFIVE